MLSLVQAPSRMDPVCPFPVANEPEKFAVPKFASGWIWQEARQREGASATHSADELASPDWAFDVVNDPPVVTFLMVRVYVFPDREISADMVSPGRTAN